MSNQIKVLWCNNGGEHQDKKGFWLGEWVRSPQDVLNRDRDAIYKIYLLPDLKGILIRGLLHEDEVIKIILNNLMKNPQSSKELEVFGAGASEWEDYI